MKLHLTALVTAIALSGAVLTPVFAANTPAAATKPAATSAMAKAAPTKTASTKKTATPDPKRFSTEALATAACPTDTVVWANTRSKIFHLQGTSTFGKGKNGAFMCQTDAKAEGFKPTKKPEKVVSAAAK